MAHNFKFPLLFYIYPIPIGKKIVNQILLIQCKLCGCVVVASLPLNVNNSSVRFRGTYCLDISTVCVSIVFVNSMHVNQRRSKSVMVPSKSWCTFIKTIFFAFNH